MDGQVGCLASGGRRPTGGVEEAERGEQLGRGGESGRRGRVEPAQLVGRRAPAGQLEGERGEVDHLDLGHDRGGSAPLLGWVPEPNGEPWAEAPGPAGALVGRGDRGRFGLEPGHPRGGIEPGHPHQAGVDHGAHAGHGEARLGDVGADDHPPPTRRARGQGEVLVGSFVGARQRADVHRGRQGARCPEAIDHPAHVGDPGDERQHVALGALGDDRADRAGHEPVEPVARPGDEVAHLDGVGAALGADHRRRGGRAGAEQRGEAVRVERGRHGEHPEVGPQPTPDVEQQRQGQIGHEVALVHLVEDHEAGALQARVGLDAADEDALGHDLDPGAAADPTLVAGAVADGRADRLAEQVGHALGRGAGREAARLEHHDPLVDEPRFAEQVQRHHGRLAGARRSDEDRPGTVGEGEAHAGDRLLHRQPGGGQVHGAQPPGAAQSSGAAIARS